MGKRRWIFRADGIFHIKGTIWYQAITELDGLGRIQARVGLEYDLSIGSYGFAQCCHVVDGTTQAALDVLMNEQDGFPVLLKRAVAAAADRSRELSNG